MFRSLKLTTVSATVSLLLLFTGFTAVGNAFFVLGDVTLV